MDVHLWISFVSLSTAIIGVAVAILTIVACGMIFIIQQQTAMKTELSTQINAITEKLNLLGKLLIINFKIACKVATQI